MYKRALEGYEAAFGATSTFTYIPALSTLENFGLLCERNGQIDTALLYYQRALVGTEAVWGQYGERYFRLSTKLSSFERDTLEVVEREEPVQMKTNRRVKWKKLGAKLSGMYKPK